MRSPFARAIGAAMLLALYYWVLATHPFAPPMAAADQQIDDDIRASRAWFEAGRFAEALPPTERLATQLSSQAVYHDRHARILHALRRPGERSRRLGAGHDHVAHTGGRVSDDRRGVPAGR